MDKTRMLNYSLAVGQSMQDKVCELIRQKTGKTIFHATVLPHTAPDKYLLVGYWPTGASTQDAVAYTMPTAGVLQVFAAVQAHTMLESAVITELLDSMELVLPDEH